MYDYGSKYADKRIRYVDRRLRDEYRQAEKELEAKLADFAAKHAEAGKKKWQQLVNGEITQSEYHSWMKGQVFQRKRWESKIRQCQEVMHEHNVQAAKIIHENKMDVFVENYDYSAFEAEQVTGISFDAVNEKTLSNLIRKNPQMLPEWKIDEEKDYKWNYRKVNNAITQGIIQGESIDKIMKRLVDNLCTQNKNKMRMFARTAITGAQNAGRQAQMEETAKQGVEVLKEWVATLDGRTRDSHRKLDGKQVPINDKFDGELGKIEYPGDPTAPGGEVYNCRCAMITVFPKYAGILSAGERRSKLDNLSYNAWKTEHDVKGVWLPNIIDTTKENTDKQNNEKNVPKQEEKKNNAEEKYSERLAKYDEKLEDLRDKHIDELNKDKRNREKLEQLRKDIQEAQEERNDFIYGYRFSGDPELADRIASTDIKERCLAVREVLNSDEYSLPESKGSNNVELVDDLDAVAATKFNGDIQVKTKYKHDLSALIHEDLHTRSIITKESGQAMYTVPYIKRLEEGSVELYKQQICERKKIPDAKKYRRYTEPLKTIYELTKNEENLYDYSRDLYCTPFDKRLGWILDKRDKVIKSGKLSEEEKKKLNDAIDYLKKAVKHENED